MSLYDDIPLPKSQPGQEDQHGRSSSAPSYRTTGLSRIPPPRIVRSANAQVSEHMSVSRKRLFEKPQPAHGCAQENTPSSRPTITTQLENSLKQVRDAICLSMMQSKAEDEYNPLYPNNYLALRSAVDSLLVSSNGHQVGTREKSMKSKDFGPGHTKDEPETQRSSGSSSEKEDTCSSNESGESAAESTGYLLDLTFPIGTQAKPTFNPAVSGIMAKMGWKEGIGLGKAEQGLVDPVVVIGNDGRGGLGRAVPVVHFKTKADIAEFDKSVVANKRSRGPRRRSRPKSSRAVLIQGRCESPSRIQPELEMLCKSHGDVEQVVMRDDRDSAPGGTVCSPDVESVESFPFRLYAMFKTTEAAMTALWALDGAECCRTLLRTSLYPEELFKRLASSTGRADLEKDIAEGRILHVEHQGD